MLSKRNCLLSTVIKQKLVVIREKLLAIKSETVCYHRLSTRNWLLSARNCLLSKRNCLLSTLIKQKLVVIKEKLLVIKAKLFVINAYQTETGCYQRETGCYQSEIVCYQRLSNRNWLLRNCLLSNHSIDFINSVFLITSSFSLITTSFCLITSSFPSTEYRISYDKGVCALCIVRKAHFNLIDNWPAAGAEKYVFYTLQNHLGSILSPVFAPAALLIIRMTVIKRKIPIIQRKSQLSKENANYPKKSPKTANYQ